MANKPYYENKCEACKVSMHFKGFFNTEQGGSKTETLFWQCPKCKDIAITYGDGPCK